MELLKTVKRRTVISEIVYYALNLGLVALLFFMAQTIQSPVLAIVLVLLSKWRIFAVRPRYWWANIQANMVDIIVGLSVVVLLYLPSFLPSSFAVGLPALLPMQIVVSLLYALWLTIIKPLSTRTYMMLQAGTAIIFGSATLFIVSYEWPLPLVVLGLFVIGYSAARHFLYAHNENQVTLLSGIWGIIFAEVGWVAYQWTFAYIIPGTLLKLPQATIILLLLSFVAERAYCFYETKQDSRRIQEFVIIPAAFSASLILVMLLFFNSATI